MREWIQPAQEGDPQAFERLIGHCSVRLLLFVRRHAGTAAGPDFDADDIVQTVLARAWSLLPRFEDRGGDSFYRWLAAIARNALQDRYRYLAAKGRRKAVAADGERAPLDPATSVSLAAARREQCVRARVALDALPDGQREVVERHLLEGQSLREIGAALSLSRNAVWERLHRGLSSLRQVLESSSDPAVA